MGRPPNCSDKNMVKRGPWTPDEDRRLVDYINKNNGYGNWRTLPTNAGLQRCGKSCRLRWTNYLRPDIKRGRFSVQEEETIIHLHSLLGNKWSAIAASLPGRTDNEIKNYWNTHIRKRLLRMGIDPVTHTPRCLHIFHLSHLLNSPLMSSSSSVTTFNIATPQSQEYCFTKIENPNLIIPHASYLDTLEQDQLSLLATLLEFEHGQVHHGNDWLQQDSKMVPSYGNLIDDPISFSPEGLIAAFDQFNGSSTGGNTFDVFQSSLSSPSTSLLPLDSNLSYYVQQ